MVECTREITKDMYDISMQNNGKIPTDKQLDLFGSSICYGYGLYGTKVRKQDDKFYVDFEIGESCD